MREVREALAQPQELAPLMRREFARALLRAMPRHALAADHLDAWFTPHTRTLEKRGPHMERALVAELDEDSLRLLVVASVDDYDRSRVLEAVLAQAVWREPEVRASVRGLPRDAEPEALVERLQPRIEAALSAWEAFAERCRPGSAHREDCARAEDVARRGLQHLQELWVDALGGVRAWPERAGSGLLLQLGFGEALEGRSAAFDIRADEEELELTHVAPSMGFQGFNHLPPGEAGFKVRERRSLGNVGAPVSGPSRGIGRRRTAMPSLPARCSPPSVGPAGPGPGPRISRRRGGCSVQLAGFDTT
ncbi:MAG: hypothetical protein H6740_15100 [Alphaproteobacteria bacterium]|nr:hypothetical protein [Alphaproteobacteria bacterium]